MAAFHLPTDICKLYTASYIPMPESRGSTARHGRHAEFSTSFSASR